MLLNTATVNSPVGVTDPVPGNNSATDTNTVGPQADLSTPSRAPAAHVTGAPHTYTVTVSNVGPIDVSNPRCGFAPTGLSGLNKTCCRAAPARRRDRADIGQFDTLVTLPAGGLVRPSPDRR